MDTTEGNGTAVPNAPTGATEPGLAGSQELLPTTHGQPLERASPQEGGKAPIVVVEEEGLGS